MVGRQDVALLLVQRGACVNKTNNFGWTPLTYSVNNGHYQTTSILLQNGACPNKCDANGWTSLMHAARNGHWPIARLLLEHGADPLIQTTDRCYFTIKSSSSSSQSSSNSDQEAMNVEKCVDIGWSALMLASAENHENFVSGLLHFLQAKDPFLLRCLVQLTDRDGRTAAHVTHSQMIVSLVNQHTIRCHH